MLARVILFISFICIFSVQAVAQPSEAAATPAPSSSIPLMPQTYDPSTRDKLLNFSSVYAAQWAFYLVSQRETIADEGKIENISNYIFDPHFDRDSLEYNVIRHTMAGASYYLFYRARGYSERRAFFWTVVSSATFEFTIETLTERPSYQDLFVTPMFGTAFAMGVEDASRFLRSRENWFARGLGYLINPALIFSRNPNVAAVPVIDSRYAGAKIEWRF